MEQIRYVFDDNLRISFVRSPLESPPRGNSNEYPQYIFLWRNKENCPLIIIKYPPDLFTEMIMQNEYLSQRRTAKAQISLHRIARSPGPAPIAQLVECPLRGTGGHGFDPGPRHTKVVKNGTSCSSLGTQT